MPTFLCPALHGVRVLVVDPHDDSRELLAIVLHDTGATVFSASDSDVALKAFDALEPALVVTELAATSFDRHALVRTMRKRAATRGQAVRIAACTSFARESDRRDALAAGYDLYLTKPLPLEVMLTSLAELVTPARQGVPVAS